MPSPSAALMYSAVHRLLMSDFLHFHAMPLRAASRRDINMSARGVATSASVYVFCCQRSERLCRCRFDAMPTFVAFAVNGATRRHADADAVCFFFSLDIFLISFSLSSFLIHFSSSHFSGRDRALYMHRSFTCLSAHACRMRLKEYMKRRNRQCRIHEMYLFIINAVSLSSACDFSLLQ